MMPDICPICFPASADPSSSAGNMTMGGNLKLLLWKNFILKVGKALVGPWVPPGEALNVEVMSGSNNGLKRKINFTWSRAPFCK